MHVSTAIPSGNACILEVRTDTAPPEIHFAPSPGDGPEAIWFCFLIDPGEEPPPYLRCVMHFFENLLGNSTGTEPTGLHPVYRTEEADWTRIEKLERIETPDGRILAAWTVPGNAGKVEVALSFPYGQLELNALLRDLHDTFVSVPIGATSDGNLIQRLANRNGASESDHPGIYCLARQHAAEAPGSWVLDGFLRRIAQAASRAPLVWAVPFTDLDGVLTGSAGKDRFPWDFNRAWGSKHFPPELKKAMGSHPMRHEIKAIQNDLRRWQNRCRTLLVLDFHAPTICHNEGIYIYLRDVDSNNRPDTAHAEWVSAIEEALDPTMRAEAFVKSGRYSGRWNTARVGDFVNQAMGLPEITLETPYGCCGNRIFQRRDYQTAGDQIAQSILTKIHV